MTATRSRKQVQEYNRHRQKVKKGSQSCPFCELDETSPQTIEITSYFKIVKNIFPYSTWDSHAVDDHLLLIPKLHTDTLADLPDKADVEYVKLISDYELRGYNFYARAPRSHMKSVEHQHTHLIKTSNKLVKFLFYLNKPYLRWVIK